MVTSAPDRDAARRPRRADDTTPAVPLYRWAHVVILCLIVVVNLVQAPGFLTFDTKLDLVENPAGFMVEAMSVWSPEVNMGSLQNQAYGYLFPVAPFFALGDALGIPMWLWQRVWSALLMIVAYEGMRRLARAVGGIGPGGAVLAGLAFALAPRVLMTVGVLTGETLPGTVLPWTVLPLIHAWHGRATWLRAVVLSAATLPFMSGVNATEVICTLPLPGLVILCARMPWRDRARWAAAWTGLVLLACAWWLLPLMFLGRYAPPFLDYIESAENTTGPLGWLAVLRGSTHWLSYLGVDDSHWITGFELAYRPLLVVAATAVSVVGLIGLARHRSAVRWPFLLAALFGVVAMAMGHGGPGGSLFSESAQNFLDGPGAPFRNIHKLDPIVRAGLSIGLAWASASAAHRLRTSLRADGPAARRRLLPRLPAVAAVLAVGVLATPAVQGDLRAPDGWRDLPQPWQEMRTTLQDLPEASRVLVLPGLGFADQTWGRTVDEPIQTMDSVNWASRSQVPLVSPGGLRLLESIEERVGTGRPSDTLAPMLAQAGFSHVVVRNDLTASNTAAPSPARLHATLRTSEGFRPQQSYGVGADGFPMVELYALTGAVPRARAVDATGLRELAGESDHLLSLKSAGVLGRDEVVVGRGSGLPTSGRVLTEGAERRERSFGRVHDAITSVRGPDSAWEQDRAAHDYGAVDTDRLTTVDYGPVETITASSANDSVTTVGPVRRDRSLWAAFDGYPETHFVTAPYSRPRGQWISLRLKESQRIGTIKIAMGDEGAVLSRLRVTTDAGTREVAVPPSGKLEIDDLGGATDDVRIAVAGVREANSGAVHVADVEFSELKPSRTEVVHAPADSSTTMAFRTWPGRSECFIGPLGVHCEQESAMQAEEAGGLARQVTVTETGRWTVSGRVRATGGKVIDDLLLPVKGGITTRASSTYAVEALSSPSRAVDNDENTGWTSGVDDRSPWLDLSWREERKLTSFDLDTAEEVPGEPARVFGASVDGTPVKIEKSGGGWRFEKPVTGTSLRITLHPSGADSRISVGEVKVAGLGDLVYRPEDSHETGLPCGFGPPVTVGGQTVQTRIRGTIGDVKEGRLMEAVACSGDVELAEGTHRVAIEPAEGFAPTALTLTPEGAEPRDARDLPLAISEWDAASRRVSIGGTDRAVLTIPENTNDGWVARLGDEELEPVMVDGWKQGYVVPAGEDRVVTLTYTPTTPYRLSLMVGGLLALALMVVAAVIGVRRQGLIAAPTAPPPAPEDRPGLRAVVATTLGLAVVAGPVVALAFAGATVVRPARRALLGGLLILVSIAAAIWWARDLGNESVRSGTDIAMALVTGAAFGLAIPSLRARRKESR